MTVQYQECEEVPQDDCKNKVIKEPFQEKVHQKKCLLPSDVASNAQESVRGRDLNVLAEGDLVASGSNPVPRTNRGQPRYKSRRRQ